MPKLPDPTLFPAAGSPGAPPGSPSGEIVPPSSPAPPQPPPPSSVPPSPAPPSSVLPQGASIRHLKPSPFRLVGPLLVVLFLGVIGFLGTRYLILPRFSKEAVTLTYWGLWEPTNVLAPAIAKFEAENPTIKVNYQMHSKIDYRERLQSALAREEGPDIMRIHATWMPMLGDNLAGATSQQMSVDELTGSFYPVVANDLVKNGAVVGIPLMTEGLGLFVNNEILAATSSGVPTNWDDLRKTAFALTVRDERGQIIRSGMAMGTTGNVTHWPDILAILMLQNSVDLTKPDSTIDAKGRNLGADALRFYTIFTIQDRIWDNTLPPDIVAFANQKVAMMIAPSWQAHEVLAINPQLDFSIYPIPQLSSQRKITWASYWFEAVSKTSKHKSEAWKLLRYLTSQETLQTMYTEATKIRAFGEPYPRKDMASTLSTAKYAGAYITQAPDARSWYLSSRTHDNGINDEMIEYYKDAINAIHEKKETPEEAIVTAAKGVQQVLTKYRVK